MEDRQAIMEDTPLKYADGLSKIAECPPNGATRLERSAFRYVFNPIGSDSFVPVALKNPKRLLGNADPSTKCSFWALSMNASDSQAREYFRNLIDEYPKIAKDIGDHLAEIPLSPSDGIQSATEATGHFDLHEQDGVQLWEKAVCVGIL